ncbi:MAG: Re/Si-specific NAD(P)(+) transhydrogenase subunit alpha [Pseudanabaenaceae cyanobacterium SKYGB_i_bin29]|nr:Re/Si-specific NAD(P)(+) transhydrogenase subunit alpha [Pseudanabaenaceae cyanobacterium SKYG29]MDW8421453.1 Re/Si-specific NAD(P)(+) transhydrogenase subunit alpha [Pseudanabaenaceae cyanobacterium SKYGB_i_bin29]
MKIAVVNETRGFERRVALVPSVIATLVKRGWTVTIETGAGLGANITDSEFQAVGAAIGNNKAQILAEADVIAKVSPPTPEEWEHLHAGQIVVGFLNPLGVPQTIAALNERGVTGISMEMIPRTSRAQSMDALSSQASIAGYKAVILAAEALPRYFPMLTTAAGTIPPARVLVMGAGVAGLQAIATARRLGAVVEAYDIRPAVKEEVQSLGAKFIEITLNEETTAQGGYAREISQNAQEYARQILTKHVQEADVVITTAQVPGKKAPILVTEEMIAGMKPGAVIVDLAAEQGGNCVGSQPGQTIEKNGVKILGPVNLPSTVAVHASQLYSKNICNFLQLLVKDKAIYLDFSDDIVSSACVCHGGEIRHPRVKEMLTPVQV